MYCEKFMHNPKVVISYGHSHLVFIDLSFHQDIAASNPASNYTQIFMWHTFWAYKMWGFTTNFPLLVCTRTNFPFTFYSLKQFFTKIWFIESIHPCSPPPEFGKKEKYMHGYKRTGKICRKSKCVHYCHYICLSIFIFQVQF